MSRKNSKNLKNKFLSFFNFKLDFFTVIVYNNPVMSNNINSIKSAFANCEGEAFTAIANFARTLCESLTDNDIVAMFDQSVELCEDYNEIIENAKLDGLRIEKHFNVTDTEAFIDENISEDIDSESINIFEMDGYIIVNYATAIID